MEESWFCPRCGNEDSLYIGSLNGRKYCRKCLSFVGTKAEPLSSKERNPTLVLNFKLSQEQKEIADAVCLGYKQGLNTLVYAVTGAGKTELTYSLMEKVLRDGGQVGFALPRKDVVIELAPRIQEAFPFLNVTSVYGGHHDKLTGDIIVLTTHQLFRYENYFDLLVMDEIDAFPYKDNDLLEFFFKRSVKGHFVLLTATPTKKILQQFQQKGHQILELRTRFHRRPLPVPRAIIIPDFLRIPYLLYKIKKYQKEEKPLFIFAPTIAIAEYIFSYLKLFVKGGGLVHSEEEKYQQTIFDFKKGKLSFLVTTSILERGVTIKNLQVIVVNADTEWIYDSSTLIQIAGRVGRKADAPDGEVLFLTRRHNKAIKEAIEEIKYCNGFLSRVF